VTILGGYHLQNEVLAEELWRVSEDLTREHLVSQTGADLNDFERALQQRKTESK
jgi:hypothetical protein